MHIYNVYRYSQNLPHIACLLVSQVGYAYRETKQARHEDSWLTVLAKAYLLGCLLSGTARLSVTRCFALIQTRLELHLSLNNTHYCPQLNNRLLNHHVGPIKIRFRRR